jgi:foldase protein PrsA
LDENKNQEKTMEKTPGTIRKTYVRKKTSKDKKTGKYSESKKMSKDTKIFIGVVIVAILAVTILFINILRPEDIASVEKSKVTSDEFQYYYSQTVNNLIQNYGNSADMQKYITDNRDGIKQQALTEAVQMELLLVKAKKDKFKFDNKEIEESWGYFKESLSYSASQNNGMTLEDFCKGYFGISLNKVEGVYKNSIKAMKYFDAKSSGIIFEESELTAFYEESKDYIDKATVRHILIAVEADAEESVVNEKKALAEDILKRVNEGEDFAALAKEYSEDPGSKDKGGVYEIQPSTGFVPEFLEWTFSHAAGDTGIVKTTHGFHVMKLDSISNTLEQQRETVVNAYKSQKYQEALNESLSSGEYNVEVKEGFEKF